MRSLLWIAPVAAQLLVDLNEFPDFEEILSEEVKLSENNGIVQPKLCDDKVQQHAGLIPFTGEGGNKKQFFFWLFESRSKPSEDPLVLWLSGGPGCSSSLALFAENGPCTVNEDGSGTSPNPNSWNNNANVMWVDQPANTGFSEGSYVKDEEGVKEDMFAFLQAFYKSLPQYKKNRFYVTGESYGGHYVPAVSHRIAQGGGEFEIPLAGIAIGNGLTNPEEQYKWYIDMAKDGGKAQGGTTTPGAHLSSISLSVMKTALPLCERQIKACNSKDPGGACSMAFLVCNFGEIMPFNASGYNPYDVREKCKKPPLCYDFSAIDKFLNDAKVQAQLGVKSKWEECSKPVNLQFNGDFMRRYDNLLPPLLAKNIKILIYAGDADFICNWIGNKHWAMAMEWPGKDAFQKAEDKPVTLGGKEVGKQRSANGFSYLQVYGAGHMVPKDRPEVALQMINSFIAPSSSEEVQETLIYA